MSSYDPKFWEVSVDPAILEEVLAAPDVLDQLFALPEDEQAAQARADAKAAALALIKALIHTQLTPRQAEIVQLYFYENKTQDEIAAQLGINQQVVSKHLFGVLREGHKVGGALKKLRKLCDQAGIDPQKWV